MLRILRRRGWVLVAAVLITTLFADLVASHRGVTYSADSTAVVSASPNSLLTPDQSNTLAGTYAVLIPKDTAILSSVASRLGTSVSDVQKRISVINTTGTALLQIDYRGTSAANSIAGATAALRAITGSYPVSPNIIPGSVGAVQAPTKASASKSVGVLVAIGVILGLALGALLMVVWERVDPRIDRPEDLSQETGSPASPVNAISESGANALLTRWKTLAERWPSKIALVPVTPDVQADLAKVASRFNHVPGNGAEAPWRIPAFVDVADDEDDATQPHRVRIPTVIACEVPGADLTALQPIMECGLVVLVARRGTPRAALRELLDSLTEFGVSPKWAIFLGGRSVRLPGRAEAR